MLGGLTPTGGKSHLSFHSPPPRGRPCLLEASEERLSKSHEVSGPSLFSRGLLVLQPHGRSHDTRMKKEVGTLS